MHGPLAPNSLARMTADPTWRDVALDAATALALLEWQREMGVDEAILDAPLDRFAESIRPPAAAADEPEADAPPSGLWWQSDPQLRDRYR